MAIKSTLFLLAFLLLATQMASSLVDVEYAIEKNEQHHHHHHHHHSKAPAKAPAHAPTKAPVHPPTPDHAPTKAPVHPPTIAPAHPPVFPHTHFCEAKCESHCKSIRPRRWCMKTCTACCAKFKCVPDGSKHYCNKWDVGVIIHGKIKCPPRN